MTALAALLFATLLDCWTTQRLLDQGGRELNPVVRSLMDLAGNAWWVALVVLTGALGGAAVAIDQEWVAWLGAGVHALAAAWNHKQLK